MALADRIMEAMRARPTEIPLLLQNASPSALVEALPALRYAADSTEAAVTVTQGRLYGSLAMTISLR